QWDEMNIMMTYHPEDKDYGHMKINEPPTPYNKLKDPDGEEGGGPSCDPISDDEPETLLNIYCCFSTVKKKEFEEHRKYHYNEFAQVKLARKLI
ncbi:predicted protein, partial [Nematostella vectensis]